MTINIAVTVSDWTAWKDCNTLCYHKCLSYVRLWKTACNDSVDITARQPIEFNSRRKARVTNILREFCGPHLQLVDIDIVDIWILRKSIIDCAWCKTNRFTIAGTRWKLLAEFWYSPVNFSHPKGIKIETTSSCWLKVISN